MCKVGTIVFKNAGYFAINLRGVSKTAETFAEVSDIILGGEANSLNITFTKINDDHYFYWGRRGPSVHLSYSVPEKVKDQIEWFYNEISVPKGEDPIGSYFMVNGFGKGYFGIQVNRATERRVLFSL